MPEARHSAEVTQHAARAEASTRRLLVEAIGRDVSPAGYDSLFHALRGFALSRQLSRAVPVGRSRAKSPDVLQLFLRQLAGDGTAGQW